MKKQFIIISSLAMLALSAPVFAGYQDVLEPERAAVLKKSGVRVGGTFITPFNSESGEELKELLEYNDISNFVTQFGWQTERHFTTDGKRNGAVTEFVLLAGGLDQGVVIPSISWLIGYRLDNGFEFGGGPNITAIKNLGGNIEIIPAFVWGTGYAFKAGDLYFPVNVSVTKNRSSMRTSILVGYVFE